MFVISVIIFLYILNFVLPVLSVLYFQAFTYIQTIGYRRFSRFGEKSFVSEKNISFYFSLHNKIIKKKDKRL